MSAAEIASVFAETADANLQVLAEAVHARGARLLVMTEASSYLAPSHSFMMDLRYSFLRCDDGSVLSYAAMDSVLDTVAEAYLDAGRHYADHVFDLRAAVSPLTDGPEGGRFMYDALHYTPEGSQAIADILRPVLDEIIAESGTEPD
jgi:hypothetical protein